MSGKKILDGLRDAVAGNFMRVTIDDQTWVRADKLALLISALAAVRPYVATKADSFGSDWNAAKLLKEIDEALKCE